MTETSRRNYRSMDMPPEGPAVSWTRFFVFEAGKTHGTHLSVVKKLKAIGQTEVKCPEECDYLLVICPAVSRVGTNISEALGSMPAGKPVILVVMHHTFKKKQALAESRGQVNDPNVHLTVDFLFYEQNLLDCDRNDIAWFEIKRFLLGPGAQFSRLNLWKSIIYGSDHSWRWIIGGTFTGVVLVSLVTILIIFVNQKKT